MLLLLVVHSARAAELTGTVTGVQGDDVTVSIEPASTPQPAVGDRLTIMQRPNEDGNALGVPGEWVITEVSGNKIKASGQGLVRGMRPQVDMVATIKVSKPGNLNPPVDPKPTAASGKVSMVRGKIVTIKLGETRVAPVMGDTVELSFSVPPDKIPVGTWRVSRVSEDGTLEAEPVVAKGQPTVGLDALILADGARAPEPPPAPSNHIPSLNAEVTELLFFESDSGLPPRAERVYDKVFQQSSTHFINWELRLTFPKPGRRIDFPIRYKYIDPQGNIVWDNQVDRYIESGWTNSYSASGFKTIWITGRYRFDAYVAGQLVASESFEVVADDAGVLTGAQIGHRIPSLSGEVVNLYFYESGPGLTAYGQRKYRKVFRKDDTRYVCWEIRLVFARPGRQKDLEIVAKWRAPNGKEWEQTWKGVLGPDWTSSLPSKGWGDETAGRFWSEGSYRVDLHIAGEMVASGNFEILPAAGKNGKG